MSIKQWKLNHISAEKSRILSSEYDLPPLVSDVLVGRGLDTPQAVEDFFSADSDFFDPFSILDMDRAAERILQALERDEKIAVYGDYDCDGVTATAILYQYFVSIGANAVYYIPERDGEGYGLNAAAVQSLSEQGVGLIVTVDNGISAVAEVNLVKRLGMDIVITDHHQPGDTLPDAAAVVDPHRKDCGSPYRYLCGAGVALKLVAALEDGNMDSAVEYFGDLAAIGTIGDVVPLTGENRKLVKRGLQMLQNTENMGLNALLQLAGLEDKTLTAENVAFGIVPRINAAGRMGSARLAMELLLCESEEEAADLAQKINDLNKQRQQQEIFIMEDIERLLSEHPEKLKERVLVLAGENWHHGVIGIVSAKISERFSKPNLLISVDGKEATGSARSFGEFSLFKALTSCSSLLTKYGGHKQAAGFSLPTENIEGFSREINRYAREYFDEMPRYTYVIDRTLTAEEMTVENIEQLELLQPFGAENQSPVFLVKQLKVSAITPLSDNKHIKITFETEHKKSFQGLYFGMSTDRFCFEIGNTVDLVASVGINEYNGRKSVSVKIKDIRPSDFPESQFFSAKTAYEKITQREPVDSRLKGRILPSRDEIAFLYQLLKKNRGFHQDVELLYIKIMETKLNYCKFRFVLDILNELRLIELSPLGNDITVPEQVQRVDLNNSGILQRLNQI